MDKHVKCDDISLAEAIAFVLNLTLPLWYVGSTECTIAVQGAQNMVYLGTTFALGGGAGEGEPFELKLKLSRNHRTHQVMFCKSGMSPVTIKS